MKTRFRTPLLHAFTALFVLFALIASGGCSYMEEYDYYTLDFPEYNDMLRQMDIPLTPIDYSPRDDAMYKAMENEKINQPQANVPTASSSVPTKDYDTVPNAADDMQTTPPSNGREYREIAEPQPSSEDEAAMAEYDAEGGYQVAAVDPESTGVTEEVAVEETVSETAEEATAAAADTQDTVYEEIESTEPVVESTEVKIRDENGRPVVETVVTTRTTTVKRSAAPDYYEQESTVIAPAAPQDEPQDTQEVLINETRTAAESIPEPIEETATAEVVTGESDLSETAEETAVETVKSYSEPAPAEEKAAPKAVPSGLDDL